MKYAGFCRSLILLSLCLAIIISAQAARQGEPGAQLSSGQFEITLNVRPRLSLNETITNTALPQASFPQILTPTANIPLCVQSPGKAYFSIEVVSSGHSDPSKSYSAQLASKEIQLSNQIGRSGQRSATMRTLDNCKHSPHLQLNFPRSSPTSVSDGK